MIRTAAWPIFTAVLWLCASLCLATGALAVPPPAPPPETATVPAAASAPAPASTPAPAPPAEAKPPPAKLSPVVAWALEDLDPDERAALAAIAASPESPSVDLDRVQSSLDKLALASGWQVTALSSLVPPGKLAPTPERQRIDGEMRKIAQRLGNPECRDVARNIKAFADKKPVEAAITRDLLAAGGDKACVPRPPPVDAEAQLRKIVGAALPWWKRAETPPAAAPAKPEPDPLRGYHFITIIGREDDDIRVFISPSRDRRAEYFRIDPAMSYRVDDDRVAFFAAVPARHIVTVQVLSSRFEIPLVQQYQYVTQDYGRHAEPKEAGCLRLDIDKRATDEILLDGHPVRPGFQFVPTEAHEVIVLEPDWEKEKGRPRYRILASQRVEPESIQGSRCFRVAFQLRRPEAGPNDEPSVSVASARSDQSCVGLGVDAASIEQYAEDALLRAGRRVLKFDDWRTTVERVGHMRDVITTLRGKPAGETSTRADLARALTSGAEEMLRQDFRVLASIEIGCRRGATPGGFEYTVTANVLDLGKISSSAAQGPNDPLQIERAWRNRRETVEAASDVRDAVAATLLRLLDEPYVRFNEPRGPKRFESAMSFGGEVYAGARPAEPEGEAAPPGGAPQAQAAPSSPALGVRLAWWSMAPEACRGRERGNRLPDGGDRDRPQAIEAPADGVVPIRLPFDPSSSGTYLVALELVPSGAREETPAITWTSRCVEVDELRFRLGVDLGYGGSIAQLTHPDAIIEELSYMRAVASASWQWSVGSIFWLGVGAGYSRAAHQRAAPASWSDAVQGGLSADGVHFDEAGQLSHGWVRQSFLVGPTFILRGTPFGWAGLPFFRRVQLGARLMPFMADFGFLDTSGVPPALSESLTGSDGLDPDLSAFLELGPSLTIGDRLTVSWMWHFGLLGYDDWLFNLRGDQEARETWRRVTNDANLVMGFTLGVEVGL